MIKETTLNTYSFTEHISNQEDLKIVKEMETLYPETMNEFKSILQEQYILFSKKQKSYGPGNISLGTDLQKEDDIKMSLIGLFFRLNDKVNRLKQLVVLNKDNPLKNESVEDTYMDLSIYSVIALIVKKKKWGK